MTLVLDSRDIPAVERADAVRHAIASTIVHVEIDFPRAGDAVAAQGVISDLGALTVCSIRSNATTVERTPRLARDELEPSIFLGLQQSGTSLVVQGGRETVLSPGDLVVYDSTAPYTLVDPDGIAQHFFRVPISRLALPHDAIRAASAVVLGPGHPVSDLVSTHLQRLASDPAIFDSPGSEAVGPPTIEFIRAVISTHLDARGAAADSLHATLRLRILEYVRAHLAEPGLDADQVATAHHISRRQLYKVLSEEGITLGDRIRAHRLQECRDQLGGPGAWRTTVEAVARRWGFADMSSFSRAFRREYGMSPRQWRELCRGSAPR